MKNEYYYFISGLPEISLDETKLSVSQMNFREEVRTHVEPGDYELFKLLFLHFDNQNLINILEKQGRLFNPLGVIRQDVLEEALKNPAPLPGYMRELIRRFQDDDPLVSGMSWENQLATLFYDHCLASGNEFVRVWFEFDRNLKNILVALNCRKHGKSPEYEIVGDYLIGDMLRRSNAADFGIGKTLPYFERLVHYYDNPDLLEREKSIDSLRWKYVEDVTFFHYFTIERILAYTIRLRIAERWLRLDSETGGNKFRGIIREMVRSFSFPAEFA